MNKLVQSYIKRALAPPQYLNPSYTRFSEEEGVRDYKIQRNINEMNFRGMTVTAVQNALVTPNLEQKEVNTLSEARMDWNNHFMVTPNQADRMNNVSQHSFVTQRQMTTPNVYGQFYAFMKAMSAAFGTLQS